MSPLRSALLHLYYYGSQPIRRRTNLTAAADGRAPIVLLFYHRIADDRETPWTTSNRSFERQIWWLADRFDLVSLEESQRRIRSGQNRRPAVSITFDDGYAENLQHALPLLIRNRIPCTYFVTLKNVLEGEPFDHDRVRGHYFPPNTMDELRMMADSGVEIGAHTFTHPDLAQVRDERKLHLEVAMAGEELQMRLARPVRYFAFPFGQRENMTARVFQLAYEAGYEGVCSAYGGYNLPGDDAFHLQRIPGDEEMIRLKNRTTIDPRILRTRRFEYDLAEVERDRALCSP